MKQASIHTEPTQYLYDNKPWLYKFMYAFFSGFVQNDDYAYDIKPTKNVNFFPITSYTYDYFSVSNTDYDYFCGDMNKLALQNGYYSVSAASSGVFWKHTATEFETGFDYFGARYYSSDLSVWLSVDPMSDMYPSTSPFMYVRGNPVMLIDPDGMNDTKYQNGLTKEELEIDDGIDATEIVWKQEDWNDLKDVKNSYSNNNSNRNIEGADITGKRPSKNPVGNSGSSSGSKSSESILKRFQNWWDKTFGIEIKGSSEGGEGYGREGASDRKVDVTKNPLDPKRIGIGKEPSEIVNERGISLEEKNMPQSIHQSRNSQSPSGKMVPYWWEFQGVGVPYNSDDSMSVIENLKNCSGDAPTLIKVIPNNGKVVNVKL